MTDKEVKSFDTVDLLAPMDLIPIKGSESPAIKVETESKPEANTKTDKYAHPNLEGRSTEVLYLLREQAKLLPSTNHFQL